MVAQGYVFDPVCNIFRIPCLCSKENRELGRIVCRWHDK